MNDARTLLPGAVYGVLYPQFLPAVLLKFGSLPLQRFRSEIALDDDASIALESS